MQVRAQRRRLASAEVRCQAVFGVWMWSPNHPYAVWSSKLLIDQLWSDTRIQFQSYYQIALGLISCSKRKAETRPGGSTTNPSSHRLYGQYANDHRTYPAATYKGLATISKGQAVEYLPTKPPVRSKGLPVRLRTVDAVQEIPPRHSVGQLPLPSLLPHR